MMKDEMHKAPTQWGKKFRHVRSGGEYEVVATGFIEADLTPCTIYMSLASGTVWVRPFIEFNDGRFECIDHEGPHRVHSPQKG